jgi:hypothetical protein
LTVSELLAPAGVALVRSNGGTVELLGWRSVDERLEMVLSRLDADGKRLVLIDYHASRAARVGDKYRLVANDRPEAISILRKLFESIPERDAKATGDGAQRRTSEHNSDQHTAITIEYVTRGARGRDVSAGSKRTARWQVRGHYRNHWFPSKQTYQRIWIAEHAAGPVDGEPLLRDIVRVIEGRG